jgi:hypothetical protein
VNDEKRDRLIQILGMMGSTHDGEVLNAARLAQRLIGSEALTWEEVFKGLKIQSGHNGADSYNSGYAAGYAKGLKDGYASTAPAEYRSILTWRKLANDLKQNYYDDLTEWEQEFVASFCERGWNNPTPKQRAIFERIAEGLGIDYPGMTGP